MCVIFKMVNILDRDLYLKVRGKAKYNILMV